MRLALSQSDCARLGCPESMDISLSSLTNREAIALQELGFPSVRNLGRRLLETTEDDMDASAWTAFVWLALRRAGVTVDAHTLEFDLYGLRLLDDEQVEPLPAPPDDPGKAQDPDDSTSSHRKSSTRSRTSRTRSPRTG